MAGRILPLSTYTSLTQFPSRPTCITCDLHKAVKHVGLPTAHVARSLHPSPSTPAVLFLGQNPGYDEDQQGAPFIGPSGSFLHTIYIGRDLDDGTSVGPRLDKIASIYVSNTARCGTWGGYEPTDKQYRLCIPHLLPDLEAIIPTCSRLIVVLLGSHACDAFYRLLTSKPMSLKKSLDHAGTSLTLPSGRTVQVYSTYHPAFLLRKQSALPEITDRLRLISDSVKGITPLPTHPHFVPVRRPVDEP